MLRPQLTHYIEWLFNNSIPNTNHNLERNSNLGPKSRDSGNDFFVSDSSVTFPGTQKQKKRFFSFLGISENKEPGTKSRFNYLCHRVCHCLNLKHGNLDHSATTASGCMVYANNILPLKITLYKFYCFSTCWDRYLACFINH